MRRTPYSQSNAFQPSPKRRRVGLNPAASSQSSRAGTINHKLIDGSQQLRYPTSPPREPSFFSKIASSNLDESVQLDDFDLELLSQASNLGSLRGESVSLSSITPHQGLLSSFEPQNVLSLKSRFFDPSPSVTPLRGQISSPSEMTSAFTSSPLAMVHKRKEIPWMQEQLESKSNHQYETSQSSPQILTSSHGSDEFLTSGPHHESSPFNNIPLSVRGIILVPVQELPENYRSLFSFPLFNAVQSKCFHPAYGSDDNLVLSAPTGSGKTVVMELAICRLLNLLKDERFKVVYQAPTKSLCTERWRDWNTKFSALNLKCAELTGDTDHTQLRSVQNSQIIITTPEKWDSMTRKWKDHMRLMELVKLFLIDEVHILKEARGATLEAVVSRMKSIGSNVRFVALSATVPNSEDIATWLGKDATNQHLPARREHFGEEFRPVKLQKFVYGYQSTANDFAFDKVCASKLPEIIGKHACQKPIMVFCCTRNSSVTTAKELTRLWTMTNPSARSWKGPNRHMEVHNDDLNMMISAGVAFHHAGLSPSDRHAVEKGFLDGQINVICCTSTLAVGVNLPCHLVIIKNTVGWQEGGCKEYSDLEMMQMLGRAGRPQFDTSATAVILTRKERVSHYERLVSGSESLESCLHLKLIDHLNAEIGLGNVTRIETAIKWLAGTFLFVRLRRNPTHYKLKEGASQEDEDELLRQICEKDIKLLQECRLVETEKLQSTPFGEAMARYYVRFETMKILLSLSPQATISNIMDMLVQAEEFREIRLKAGEKSLYREINRDPGIRYPIKVDIALPSHKVSLLLQSELGGIDFPGGDQLQKHKFSLQQDKSLVFAHVNRLIRCVIDCQIAKEDSIAILNALELARGFGAKVWDHSPLQMKQLDQVGVVAVRKLAAAGITGLEALEATEAHEIEMALSKNPPFGTKLLAQLKTFPKLRVAVKMIGKATKARNFKVNFKFEVAFINEKTPAFFQNRPIYVCCLTETSDGRASKVQDRLEVTLAADLKAADQHIVCHVMCDDIAGTARKAELRPNVPSYIFSSGRTQDPPKDVTEKSNISHSKGLYGTVAKINKEKDAFDGDELQLDDFLTASGQRERRKETLQMDNFRFDDADWLSIGSSPPSTPHHTLKASHSKSDVWIADMAQQNHEVDEPIRLPNGNWACNHKCKDKTREGLEKPSKAPKTSKNQATVASNALNQLTLSGTITKKSSTKVSHRKTHSMTEEQKNAENTGVGRLSGRKSSALKRARKTSTKTQMDTRGRGRAVISLKKSSLVNASEILSSDYRDDSFDDLPSPSQLFANTNPRPAPPDSLLAGTTQAVEAGIDCIDLTTPTPEKVHPAESHNESTEKVDLMVEAGLPSISEPARVIEPTLFPTDQKSPEIWDYSGSDSQFVFDRATNVESSATTAPSASLWLNVPHIPKRKASVLGDAHEDEIQKRLEVSPSLDTLGPMSTSNTKSAAGLAEADLTDRAPTESDDTSTGWEDVDRMLLEEFSDIINFY
ncbi:uncharacterized protein N7459_010022 [Penicillium hispanicum]|uniref:uncharacterized protein n=1 Tax=Penicillium hispanicum TaxID=1080232 RepID=UPI0025402A1F|nr:uncharacterized protein N7459_010022 [Penicillium hispanicum]KAJ5570592.1 hypothetical protein N7459_010022 [Penicillium hispanicum]